MLRCTVSKISKHVIIVAGTSSYVFVFRAEYAYKRASQSSWSEEITFCKYISIVNFRQLSIYWYDLEKMNLCYIMDSIYIRVHTSRGVRRRLCAYSMQNKNNYELTHGTAHCLKFWYHNIVILLSKFYLFTNWCTSELS